MKYKCTECGKDFSIEHIHYLCDECGRDWVPGNKLSGVLEICYDQADKENIQKELLINNFFPYDKADLPNIPVGNTPFFKAEKLSNKHNLNLWIKNDTVNPTGSYKDRASYWVLAQAKHHNINKIVCASTGNAGSSLAGISAATDIKAKIFIPAKAPLGKRAQNIAYGADLDLVEGSYDDAYALSIDYSADGKSLNRNTGYNPITIEGKKSVALEIYQQNNNKIPAYIVIPVGDGVILSGVYKGFKDLLELGITNSIPKLIGVQSNKSNAIYNYWKNGEYKSLEHADTIADSISVKSPACADLAVRAIRESHGFMIEVDDSLIVGFQFEIARNSGIFCEPSSAVVAGIFEEKYMLNKDQQIVLLLTGHGLKDVNSILNY
ncbi:threonine synthase [bacterium]|nr:threonine synthase [bacterium]